MNSTRFARAIEALSRISAEDPQHERVGELERPRELLQAERLAKWIDRLAPNASEALRMAAYAQHVGRFRVPRSTYPEGRAGYLRWRAELARTHAATADGVLAELGYEEDVRAALRRIVQKQGLANDAEVQTMEDALCLSFLEHEFAEFASRHPDDMLVRILRKTWRKMSERAHAEAQRLEFDERAQALLARALGGSEEKEP